MKIDYAVLLLKPLGFTGRPCITLRNSAFPSCPISYLSISDNQLLKIDVIPSLDIAEVLFVSRALWQAYHMMY